MVSKQATIEIKRLQLHTNSNFDFIKPKTAIGKKLLENEFHNKQNYKWLSREFQSKMALVEQLLKTYPEIWTLDYTSMSCVPQSEKRNRYLLNKNGNYFIKGFVCAINLTSNKIVCVETEKTQLTLKDILRLKKYLPPDSILVSDKQHKNIASVSKALTQKIEIYFRHLKKPIYEEIRKYQKYVKVGKKTFIVTNISIEQLESLYAKGFKRLAFKLCEKRKAKLEFKKGVAKNYPS